MSDSDYEELGPSQVNEESEPEDESGGYRLKNVLRVRAPRSSPFVLLRR